MIWSAGLLVWLELGLVSTSSRSLNGDILMCIKSIPFAHTQPPLTSSGQTPGVCQKTLDSLCGTRHDFAQEWSWGIGYWLAGWVLPILVLIGSIPVSPLRKRYLMAPLHILGDPIDSIYSVLTQRDYHLARLRPERTDSSWDCARIDYEAMDELKWSPPTPIPAPSRIRTEPYIRTIGCILRSVSIRSYAKKVFTFLQVALLAMSVLFLASHRSHSVSDSDVPARHLGSIDSPDNNTVSMERVIASCTLPGYICCVTTLLMEEAALRYPAMLSMELVRALPTYHIIQWFRRMKSKSMHFGIMLATSDLMLTCRIAREVLMRRYVQGLRLIEPIF